MNTTYKAPTVSELTELITKIYEEDKAKDQVQSQIEKAKQETYFLLIEAARDVLVCGSPNEIGSLAGRAFKQVLMNQGLLDPVEP